MWYVSIHLFISRLTEDWKLIREGFIKTVLVSIRVLEQSLNLHSNKLNKTSILTLTHKVRFNGRTPPTPDVTPYNFQPNFQEVNGLMWHSILRLLVKHEYGTVPAREKMTHTHTHRHTCTNVWPVKDPRTKPAGDHPLRGYRRWRVWPYPS